MKKRILAVCLVSGLACFLGGCAGEKKDTVRTVKIGLTLYDQYDTFISELVSWFNASASALEEKTGTAINVEVLDAAGSQTTQNEQVKTLIEKGCDVICVNLVDRTEPTTITDMAEKNDVPIIFFNRELVAEDLERWEKFYYVGADALLPVSSRGSWRQKYSRAIRNMTRTATAAASMWCWKERPAIRMLLCVRSIPSIPWWKKV